MSGKYLSIINDLYAKGEASYTNATVVWATGLFTYFLGGFGGVAEVDPTPADAFSSAALVMTDHADPDACQFVFEMMTLNQESHAAKHKAAASWGVACRGQLIKPAGSGGKNAFGDEPESQHLQGGMRISLKQGAAFAENVKSVIGQLRWGAATTRRIGRVAASRSVLLPTGQNLRP